MELDSYDYKSQKLAVELLERFNQYRQIAFINEENSKEQSFFHIGIDFIDYKNVSRYQAIFNIDGKKLEPDILNKTNLKKITAVNKVPVIPLKELIQNLPLKNNLIFYPIDIIHKQKVDCCSFIEHEFNDLNSKRYILTLYDCAYILFDDKDKPFRCLPIHEMIKPYLEKMDLTKCKDVFIKDHENRGGNDKYEPDQRALPNRLNHYYDKKEKEIFLQICGSDRTDLNTYKYFVFDIKIQLKKEIKVDISESEEFIWHNEG